MGKANSLDNWIDSEFGNINLGDERLNKRFKLVSTGLAERSENNISSSFDSWKDIKASYRFFSNEKVLASKILLPHSQRTVERIKKCDRVLLIQDTVVFSYPQRPGTKNLGLCSKHYSSATPANGLISHSMMALSDKGVPLGIFGQKFIDRKTFKANGRLTKQQYQRLPIWKKESIKWIELIKESSEIDFGKTQTIHVADREGDIYELYRDSMSWNENFLIRASHNRAINKEKRRHEPSEKLFDSLIESKAQGLVSVKVNSKKQGKKYRNAKLSIIYKKFEMPPPPNRTLNNSDNNLPFLEMTAIMAIERNPPRGEDPLNWTLITNLSINSVAEAKDKVKLYSLRWNIELLHKIIKSGFKVESAQLRDGEKLKKYIVLKSILAWRIFALARSFRESKKCSCEEIISYHEWKVLFIKFNKGSAIPKKPPSVEEVYFWMARLGGFIGRKGDGDPGFMSIWRGWNRFIKLLEDYDAFCG